MATPSRSILIVEDERIVAADLQESLRALGYDAFAIASSADEAIERASQRCPDLVLMDIQIRGARDGIETAGLLQAEFAVPVIYLTAHADGATVARAKLTHPHGYLLKPIKADELRSTIEVALFRHAMERRQYERARWMTTTIRSVADAIISVDLAGSITLMNPAAETLTGVTIEQAIGRPARDVLQLVDAHDRSVTDTPLDRTLRSGRAMELCDATLLSATGERRSIADSTAPVVDDGKLLGAVMVFRDVTEQRKLAAQVELADRLASLAAMASGVAHQVNNALGVIVVNTSFLRGELARERGEPSDGAAAETDVQQAQTDLDTAITRVTRIMADLRAFAGPARPEGGRADVVSAIETGLRVVAPELRDRARLVNALTPVPPVAAEEGRLAQVFIHLLRNAALAIAPGKFEHNQVSVATRVDGGRVVAEVRDTGAGMSAEVARRALEPFFTTRPVGAGTGLGLAICHGIVRSLGGDLHLDSRVGAGTTVRVSLPAAPSEAPARAGPAASEPRTGRILVIDDDDTALRAFARALRDYDPVCVASANDAVALLDRGEQFDLVLSDLTMPDMSGVELYEELLRCHPDHIERLVFLSGGAISSRIDDFLRTIPNRCLDKPISARRLVQAVQEELARRSRSHR